MRIDSHSALQYFSHLFYGGNMSRRFTVLIALVLALLPMVPVHADMGADKPLLLIRFNQPRVYFDRSLSQAVSSAERAKPGVTYDVVSYASGSDKKANENLRAVLGGIYKQGVPSQRVQIRNEPTN